MMHGQRNIKLDSLCSLRSTGWGRRNNWRCI